MANKNSNVGLKLLVSTYKNRTPSQVKQLFEKNFEIAKKEGYMFDYPEYETHEQALKRLKIILDKIDPQDVANAFLYSLSTRKLEYRSILGSYYYAKAIPNHEIMLSHNDKLRETKDWCYLCGWVAWNEKTAELGNRYALNFYNYQRYGIGGGCFFHTHLYPVLFDLEQFMSLPKVAPTEEDKEILKKILDCVKKMENKGKAGKLRDIILKEKIFKCNKEEVSVLLNILGICGILSNEDFPAYEDKFVDEYARDSIEYRNDFAYPVNRWNAFDGINHQKFQKVFKYSIK